MRQTTIGELITCILVNIFIGNNYTISGIGINNEAPLNFLAQLNDHSAAVNTGAYTSKQRSSLVVFVKRLNAGATLVGPVIIYKKYVLSQFTGLFYCSLRTILQPTRQPPRFFYSYFYLI